MAKAPPPRRLRVVVEARVSWDGRRLDLPGAEVLAHPADDGPAVPVRGIPGDAADLPAFLARLRREHRARRLVCPGSSPLAGALLAAGLVDELQLTLAPQLSAATAPALLDGLTPLAASRRWRLVGMTPGAEETGEWRLRYRKTADAKEAGAPPRAAA